MFFYTRIRYGEEPETINRQIIAEEIGSASIQEAERWAITLPGREVVAGTRLSEDGRRMEYSVCYERTLPDASPVLRS